MDKQQYTLEEAIDYVTGDVSELSELSDESDFNEIDDYVDDVSIYSESETDEEDDNIPLAEIANKGPNADEEENEPPLPHTYRWRKKDTMEGDHEFTSIFSEPPVEEVTPLQYFYKFFTPELTELVAEQTNLYSFQKKNKSIETTSAEITTLMGIMMNMGIVKLPQYRCYWSRQLRYPPIADILPRNRFQQLVEHLHFVNNFYVDKSDKLAKIRPLIIAVRNQCIKVEPEAHHSVDEQIIPSKTKFSSIRQYNPKKPKKWGFKNLVRAGASGFMYDFYIYEGKQSKESDEETNYQHLAKSAQVVAKLCQMLPKFKNHKVFFDNWFNTLDLLLYLKAQGILAVGTVRANRLAGCPLTSNKDLAKEERGSMDYRVDSNSGMIIVKWVDNSVVQMVSNFVGINPMSTIERWCKQSKAKKDIPCPQIVKQYNKSMGGVDLADMLISLYRIPCKTKRWYVKVFWHLVDIAKVNAWILYRRHYQQRQEREPSKGGKSKTFLDFSSEIAEGLTRADKINPTSSRGRPAKRRSIEPVARGKKPAVVLPIADVRYDQVGHWPQPISQKNRCRNCEMTCRMKCSKCGVYLCLLEDRNCFKDFHTT